MFRCRYKGRGRETFFVVGRFLMEGQLEGRSRTSEVSNVGRSDKTGMHGTRVVQLDSAV